MDRQQLQAKARERVAYLEQEERQPYFYRVMAALLKAGLLRTNYNVEPYVGPVTIEDCLRAGEIEPRVLEVLPAFFLKHQDLIIPTDNIPLDLAAIRAGKRPATFRGMNYRQWI